MALLLSDQSQNELLSGILRGDADKLVENSVKVLTASARIARKNMIKEHGRLEVMRRCAAENKAETAQNAAPATEETETASFDQPSTESPDQESGILNPVKWDIAIAKAGEGEYDVTFKATLDKGWYIYSQILE